MKELYDEQFIYVERVIDRMSNKRNYTCVATGGRIDGTMTSNIISPKVLCKCFSAGNMKLIFIRIDDLHCPLCKRPVQCDV